MVASGAVIISPVLCYNSTTELRKHKGSIMKLRIGQREVMGGTWLIVMAAAVLLGDTPENMLDLLLEALVPLGLTFTALQKMLGLIQVRVASGELKPGDLKGLLEMRETWYAFAVFGAGAISLGARQFLGIEFDTENQKMVTDILLNIGLLGSGQAFNSFTVRASGQAFSANHVPGTAG